MSYAGINAKIKGMRSNLASIEDYDALCRLPNVEAVGNKLKEYKGYSRAMQDIIELRREVIEQKLQLALSDDFYKIYSFIGDNNLRKYLDAYFLKNEIHILKLILCMVYDERDITYTLPELNALLGKKLSVDFQKLFTSKTLAEIIDNLKGTQFYNVLSKIYDENSTLFELEMHLDLFYYLNLWKAQNKYLKKEDKEIMNRIIGEEIDLKNLMWIYRFKSYYDLNPSTMYAYLIPISYRLKSIQINRLVETKNKEELLNEISKTVYANLINDVDSIESIYYKRMLKVYRKTTILHPNTILTTIAYMFYKELEINNITSLLEGVRYSLAPKQILEYLYLPEEIEVS